MSVRMHGQARIAASFYGWQPRSGESGVQGRYAACVLGMVAVAIYANLPVYAYVLDAGLLPKFVYFAAVASMAPLLFTRRHLLGSYLASPFALWCGLFVLLNLIHLSGFPEHGRLAGAWLVDSGMEARRAVIATRIQYTLFALVLGFAVHACVGSSWLRALVLLALLAPCAVIVDFLQPGLLYPLDTGGAVLGRAAAMYINANLASEAILLVLLLACAATPKRWRGALFLLAGAAVLATFSRSAIIAWLLLGIGLACAGTLPRSTLALAALALGAAAAAAGAFESYLWSRDGFDDAAANLVARLDFFSTLDLGDDSAGERAEVLAAGWEMLAQNPVFGAGAGATQFWSHRGGTHNQLVMLGAEYGVLGLGLWAWMAAILWRGRLFAERGMQVALAGLYLFMSMFTHQMLDASTWWLAAFAMASGASGARTPAASRLGQGHGEPPARCARLKSLAWSYAALDGAAPRKLLQYQPGAGLP